MGVVLVVNYVGTAQSTRDNYFVVDKPRAQEESASILSVSEEGEPDKHTRHILMYLVFLT